MTPAKIDILRESQVTNTSEKAKNFVSTPIGVQHDSAIEKCSLQSETDMVIEVRNQMCSVESVTADTAGSAFAHHIGVKSVSRALLQPDFSQPMTILKLPSNYSAFIGRKS